MIRERPTYKRLARFWRIAIVVAGLFLCAIVALSFTSVRVLEVRGASMVPGFNEGDKILVLKGRANVSKGSIILLPPPISPPPLVLRRVVGVPGEVVEIRKGRLFINEVGIEESYVDVEHNKRERNVGPLRVPDHTYFVMADNRDAGFDSRDWGVITDELIYGKVLMRF